jgi:hypothetical protein
LSISWITQRKKENIVGNFARQTLPSSYLGIKVVVNTITEDVLGFRGNIVCVLHINEHIRWPRRCIINCSGKWGAYSDSHSIRLL